MERSVGTEEKESLGNEGRVTGNHCGHSSQSWWQSAFVKREERTGKR